MEAESKRARGYEDLEVYQRAIAMQKPIHAMVLRFPDYEKYDLSSQMRRACKSIPAKIVKGYGRRRSPREFCSFLSLAVGSVNEMEVHLNIARELDYIPEDEYRSLVSEFRVIGKQLTQLIKYWRMKGDGPLRSRT